MNMEQKKIRVAVIYGGASGEHPISCATAGAVLGALDPQHYEVISIGITKNGEWVPGETDPSKLQLNGATTEVAASSSRIILPPGDGSQDLLRIDGVGAQMQVTALGPVDVVFPLLHGPFGEDGTIQGLFEMANVPYVGCGVFASAAAMDKDFMKVVLRNAGIGVGPYVAVTAAQWAKDHEAVIAQVKQLQFPVYVKPARAGSSLGISRVEKLEDLAAAVEEAHRHDPKIVIEQGIDGREIECAVLGGRGFSQARASLPGEVVLADESAGFYDFEHKYVSTSGLTMAIPAAIPDEVT
ncbi:MAG: D-alanine--D-alanine ligase family protein, partial [Arcanobacterium sp.]|nr:D-alanine--D-alanine ligase family protein [Arcanobacterium sp.]